MAGTLVFKGSSPLYNITTATVVKNTAGRLARINVVSAGASAGSVSDTPTLAGVVASNLISTLPNIAGTFEIDWPFVNGLVVTPGSGQVIAVSFT